MTTTEQIALDRIGQIAIRVRDIGRAVRFYRDTLGMRFLFEVPNLAFFDCGGVRLMVEDRELPGREKMSQSEHVPIEALRFGQVIDAAGNLPDLAKL